MGKLGEGRFHDQEDAKWIVIRGQLRGHNNMPFGWPTPGWPIIRLGIGHPQGLTPVNKKMEKSHIIEIST